TRQAGEVWFLKAAQQRGVKQFLGFLNSPPVNFTKNQKAFASNGITNIDSSKFDDLGKYIVEVIKGVKTSTGVDFNYISPVNEPQWDWSDGGQEGSPYTNEDIFGVVKALNRNLQQNNLSAKIIVPESGHIRYLLADEDKPGRGNQVNAFFNSSSPYYIGQFLSVNKTIAAHSYFSTSPSSTAITMRQNIATRVASLPGINYWQSEYCILGDNEGEIKGEQRDLGITSALYVANVIHKDLVYANATAWQWWLAVSPYDYKDGLVYIDKNKSSGNVYPSKMLWAFGNYSRFIRPGMIRVELSFSESITGVTASAYIDAITKKIVVVLVNTKWEEQKISLTNTANSTALKKFDVYTTSEQKNMQKFSSSTESLSLEPRSITTLVTDY
ncbi:MAG TPA: glycoside hydrolase, partial [Lacibacter sp.]|nr:glycoside hydrolase [Lacibacter sp.]